MISQLDSSNFSKNSAELSIIIKRTETPPSPLCVFLDLVAGHIESHQVGLAGLVSLNGGILTALTVPQISSFGS